MALPLDRKNPNDLILSDDWNDLVDLANKFRIDGGKLEIKNDGDIEGEDGFNAGKTSTICLGDGSNFIQAKKDIGLTIAAEWASAGLIIRKGGDTGIGTLLPRAKLEVQGGDTWLNREWQRSLLLTGGKAATDGEQAIAGSPSLVLSSYASDIKFGLGFEHQNESGRLHIYSTNDGPLLPDDDDSLGSFQSHLVVQENGDVGIGTDSPSQKLEVAGQILVKGKDPWVNGADAVVSLGDTNHFIKSTHSKGVTIGTYGANEMNGTSPGIFLQEGGDVGIGTDQPAAKLHIRGGANWTVRNWKKSLKLDEDSAIDFGNLIGLGLKDGKLEFFDNSDIEDPSTIMVMNATDRFVGIGGNLSVLGNIRTNGVVPIKIIRKTFTFEGALGSQYYDVNQSILLQSLNNWSTGSIVGFVINPSNKKVTLNYVYVEKSGSSWNVNARIFPEDHSGASSYRLTVWVMFTRMEISEYVALS